MKSDELRKAIGNVDEDLIEAADLKPDKNRQKNVWAVAAPIAAAAAAVLLAAILLPGIIQRNRPGVGPGPQSEADVSGYAAETSTAASSESEFVADVTTAAPPKETEPRETERTRTDSETVTIPVTTEVPRTEAPTEVPEGPTMSAEIRVNRIVSEMSASFPYYSAYEYNYAPKSIAEISAYFGKDLAGMTSLQGYRTNQNYTTDFIYAKDGQLVFDVTRIVYENGSNTITISMSKTMKPYDCLYQYDGEQYSDMNGVKVLIGENTEGTHAAADFEAGGIFCRVEMKGTVDLNVLVRSISELIR